ncbi:MAG: hypothetical protein HYV63_24045 [Candidatus Schekmanbacteria bacterium]|nr:hypothetical protein [Candidatus Schekmanbacteria bacterium]
MEKALIFAAVLVAVLLIFALRAYRHHIAGTWLEQRDGDGPLERIRVTQIGPWVRARKELSGGWHDYKGTFNGRRLRLKRRDFGVDLLTAQGFPLAIARMLNGSVMARLELQITPDGKRLEGVFYPHRVQFRKEPPKILSREYLPPKNRTWQRSR